MRIPAALIGGLLLASTLAAAEIADERLTDDRVREFLARMEAAIAQQDADALRGAFSQDARIEVSELTDAGETREIFGPDRYVTDLRMGWKLANDIQQHVDNTIVALSPDGRSASVSLEVTEQREVMGQTRVAHSSHTLTIALQDGGLAVTRFIARELPAATVRGDEKRGPEAVYNPSGYDYSALVELHAIEDIGPIEDRVTKTVYYRYRTAARVVDTYKGRLPNQIRYVSTSSIERPIKASGELRIVNLCKTDGGTYFLPDLVSTLEATQPLVQYAKAKAGGWPDTTKGRACAGATTIFRPE